MSAVNTAYPAEKMAVWASAGTPVPAGHGYVGTAASIKDATRMNSFAEMIPSPWDACFPLASLVVDTHDRTGAP